MEQNLITFEKALKEVYLPAWRNQLSTEPSAFLAAIKQPKLNGHKIKTAAPIGISGGFGFGAEGQPTPSSANVNFMDFEILSKDMYVEVAISNKAVMLTGSASAMANALDVEMKAAYETAKWNTGRSLFGNGTGVLTNVIAQTSASATVEVEDYKNLKEGLVVDFYTGTVDSATTPNVEKARIKAVNRMKNGNGYYEIILEETPAKTIESGFMTVQMSFKREITGLGAIYDDNITHLYGASKEANPYIKPISIDAGGESEETSINKALRYAKRDKNNEIDMLLFGDGAFDAYSEFLRTNNRRLDTGDLKGGFKSMQYLHDNKIVNIVSEQFVPENEIWGVNTKDFDFHNMGWKFAQLQGGGIFNLKENTSVYRALLANYADLICKNPGGCVRIHNFVA